MKNFTVKTLLRSIKSSFGRYAAILAILALSVGFFTGLKNAEPAMRKTADLYLSAQNAYDFQLISSLGFTEEDLAAFSELEGIQTAEGSYRTDALAGVDGKGEEVYQFYSLPQKLALPALTAGRMPSNETECLADALLFGEEDIGKTLTLTEENSLLTEKEFTIVGLASSPRFLSPDRGSTSLGSGSVAGFIYLSDKAFAGETYHEILLRGDTSDSYFSDEYSEKVEALRPAVEKALNERAADRAALLSASARESLAAAQETYSQNEALYEKALADGSLSDEALGAMKEALDKTKAALGEAEKEIARLENPTVYLLDLNSNTGFVSFRNDIGIVSGIANAFPIFFVLVAALVCLTTMARMVNEERTVIGTMKALGRSNFAISMKYTLYAGSAALIGCAAGFFIGTGVIPEAVWSVYSTTYPFSDLAFYFSPLLYVSCLMITAAGSVGVTLLTCRRELAACPADLIRPKPPAKGKRIFLEKLSFFWKRLSFLNKVTLRNAFRSKKRMVMMLIGTAGCTALLVAGFGLKDSVRSILHNQYEEILLYDGVLSYDGEEETEDTIASLLTERGASFSFAYREEVLLPSDQDNSLRKAYAVALDPDEAAEFLNFTQEGKTLSYPSADEALVSRQLAEKLGLAVGDGITLNIDGIDRTFVVSGVCDNYIDHYIYLSKDALSLSSNSVYFRSSEEKNGAGESDAENGGTDAASLAVSLRALDGVFSVSTIEEEREILDQSLANMNYIVLLILAAAGALAFIVLHNLTNIHIMERVREVATVKVLGFTSQETASYVMRENLILAAVGGGLGLLLGKLLQLYIIGQIQVDKIVFDRQIAWWSFLLSFACTMLFALISNLFMRIKLRRIPMAESLKAVE